MEGQGELVNSTCNTKFTDGTNLGFMRGKIAGRREGQRQRGVEEDKGDV